MPADLATLALFALFLAAVVGIPLYVLRQTMQQTRGTFGRPYGNVVADLMRETARRSELLVRLVEARDTRIARLERRAESGR